MSTPPAPGAASRGDNSRLALGLLVILLAGRGAFHEQSPQLSWDEVALDALLAMCAVSGWLGLLLTSAPLGPVLRWALALAAWQAGNLLIAVGNDISPADWLRVAFPQLLFPSFVVVGWLAAPTGRVRSRLLTMLTMLGAVVVVGSLLQLRTLQLSDISDLQALRRFGGDFYAPFTTTLAFVTLATAEGRRAQPLWFTVLLLAIGLLGLAVSFTRTYWLSTTVATMALLALLLRARRRDFARLAVVLPVGIAAALIVTIAMVPENLISMLGQRLADLSDIGGVPTFQIRQVESLAALRSQLTNPLSFIVGSGLGAQFSYEYVYPVSGMVYGKRGTYLHDYYVYLLFTQGIVGLGLYLALWFALLRSMLRNLGVLSMTGFQVGHVYLAAIVGSVNLLVASLTTPQFINFQWPMIFGLLAALGARPGGGALKSVEAPVEVSGAGGPTSGHDAPGG